MPGDDLGRRCECDPEVAGDHADAILCGEFSLAIWLESEEFDRGDGAGADLAVLALA